MNECSLPRYYLQNHNDISLFGLYYMTMKIGLGKVVLLFCFSEPIQYTVLL
ncbi:hypothetical protein FHX64_001356 [Microbacter margulisiae]|uniref:Uncharacterized protein n=1 Tax=Microbacter margulisiae TaxID=1350067 RepID=A0A7W5DR48_9PORP|nr:hypothetical protein [Microbacter margulisiae]